MHTAHTVGEDEEMEVVADEEPMEEDDGDEAVELHCRVEEQKEDIDGLKDVVCGKVAEKGHAGLCK